MSFWTFVFCIAIAGMIFAAWNRKHDARHGIVRDSSGDPVAQTARNRELEREVEELRERVKVLERIATDGGDTKRLAAEIEKLRDN